MKKPEILILGDGGWGTTLAILLSKKGFKVSLWGAFAGYSKYLDKKRVNTKFLPKIKIPKDIIITHDLDSVLCSAGLIILAVPSQYLRSVLKKVKRLDYPRKAIYLSVTKGIEIGSLKRMSEVICEELGNIKFAVLSGPTIAHEVASGIPTTAVVASKNKAIREYLQGIFISDRFRLYTNDDVIGVELGGSFKNIIAIACGISDGLGFGTNTKAALLSRGLAEMSRLGEAMGARSSTFSGISGLGDLVTTCISPYSRNRFVGEQIGKGMSVHQIKNRMQMPACRQAGIAEGLPTAKSAYNLSLKYKVQMPIVREVYNVIYKNKSPLGAVKDLMGRAKREE
ncbi:MAG: NAD(P)-dependent glycerol-3-phosphate dehydrogenase [Candidatus Omnitrophica bacterium]|nr:NAD(P)-dependent glycerol-3-phosphate dehydrogenase [Candidatus Omnitrophota bacterium]